LRLSKTITESNPPEISLPLFPKKFESIKRVDDHNRNKSMNEDASFEISQRQIEIEKKSIYYQE